MSVDYTNKYNTKLSDKEQIAFKEWIKVESKKQGRDVMKDLYDYDLGGLWKFVGGFAENGHGVDTYKKPNHWTFSDESLNSNGNNRGGSWGESVDGKTTFTPSKENLKYHSMDELVGYFKEREPDVRLIVNPQSDAKVIYPNMK